MKAKIIETGEIIDVVSITDRQYGCLISYWDGDNRKEDIGGRLKRESPEHPLQDYGVSTTPLRRSGNKCHSLGRLSFLPCE